MKFTKRALAAVLSAAMMTCAFAGCGDSAASSVTAASGEAAASTAAATGDKVVKIGVYEPASGDNGAGGKQETLGIQYANKVQPTVEIGGDTTKLSKALESVNKSIKGTQSGLKDVNKLLKLDPSNTELVVQKQKMLKDAIEATKESWQL